MYNYDYKNQHFTCVCNLCIDKAIANAIDDGGTISQTKYVPCYGETAIATQIMSSIITECSKCHIGVTDCKYSYDRGNTHFKNLCFNCIEDVKYSARHDGGYKVTTKLTDETEPDRSCEYHGTYKWVTVSPSVEEHNEPFMVVCSNCKKHAFAYKSYSRGNRSGLCKECAT